MIGVSEIADKLDRISYADKRPLYAALIELKKAGEIKRIERGKYIWAGKESGKPELRKVMWRFFRSERVVSVEDLQEIAGAKRSYVKEWLQMLCRNGIAGKRGKKYIMIKDPVIMPDDNKKADRLKKIRQQKKEALAALRAADLAIRKARGMIEGIG